MSIKHTVKNIFRDIRFYLRNLRNPEWYKEAVGGFWKEIGRLQLDFLIREGLKPHHYLLDVGCGSLRGGINFINYLDPGHYFGVEKDPLLIKAGLKEIRKRNLLHKRPKLACFDNFNFSRFGVQFDYAIAISVFTHLPFNSIVRCLVNAAKVLKPGGRFYATFFENPHGLNYLEPIHHNTVDELIITYPDKDPYHYPVELFEYVAYQIGLKFVYIGDWGHPRNQKMLLFVKTDETLMRS